MTPKRSSAEQGVRPTVLAALMLGLFSVSLGYGAILPMLPDRIARVTGLAGDASALSQTTGILTGLYTAALFVFAPLWGWISDRYGRRKVLVIGLAGFGATMATFSLFESSMTLYAERFLTGLFAAAIAPVALAIVADLASADEERARRQSLVTLAGMAGFLVGPMAGAVLAQSASVLPESGPFAPQSFPLVATGILSLAASIVVLMAVPTVRRRPASGSIGATVTRPEPHLIWRLLIVSFVVAAAVGVVEVGLVLRGQREGLTAYQIATMFSECSLVMFIVQAIVFSPLVKPQATRWLIAPALLVLAVALFLLPKTSDYVLMLGLVGAVASSAGILSPIVTYWISSKAGASQGALLGRQTAAASLGATFGSVAGGVLFDLPYIKDASFLVAAVAVLLGLLAAFGLPNLLRPKKHASASGSSGAQR